ncbi:sugar kinase [Piscinibacter sp. XHJ-5]|uniref:sugar kinase n=1 Tax=Piscinibacter sp. XHJ-5 TaxID=3037797 RepID=UPI0024531629|nr:sugar kinase [Piscinibacter sp. XHJ-5]
MQLDVVTVGEAMILFAAQQTGPLHEVEGFARTTAGADLNVAIGLARLGLKVGYVSRLGDDSFGRHLCATLDREGVDRTHVSLDPENPTAFMLKSRSDDGSDPKIEYFRRGSAASRLGPADNPKAYCAASRHLHLTGIFVAVSPTTRELVFEMAADARTQGRTVSFDPNLRPSLWRSQAEMVECLNRLASHSDWILPGLDEGRLLTGRDSPPDIASFYLERGARGVVVKLGPAGAYFATRSEQGHAPGIAVERVVDTVGAGDGFAVGVVSALLEGEPLSAAAARGNAIGARVVQFPGDCDGLPTREQLGPVNA